LVKRYRVRENRVNRQDYGNEQIIAASLKENVQSAARIFFGMTRLPPKRFASQERWRNRIRTAIER